MFSLDASMVTNNCSLLSVDFDSASRRWLNERVSLVLPPARPLIRTDKQGALALAQTRNYTIHRHTAPLGRGSIGFRKGGGTSRGHGGSGGGHLHEAVGEREVPSWTLG